MGGDHSRMPEEKYVITFDQQQWLELEELILEQDQAAALAFLKTQIYEVIQKKKRKQLKAEV